MKLLEKIKKKLIAQVLALWAWVRLKAVEWKLREKAITLWEKTKAFWSRMGQKWRTTRAHKKLMAM
jgi:membrane fusion protein (multidrug efflux system)